MNLRSFTLLYILAATSSVIILLTGEMFCQMTIYQGSGKFHVKKES